MKHVWIALALFACKGKDKAPPQTAPSGSAVVAADAAAAIDAAAAGVAIDESQTDPVLAIAFAKRVPQLPAVNADSIATFESDSGVVMKPAPAHALVQRLDGTGTPERFEILELAKATELEKAKVDWAATPPDAAMQKTLTDRGAAITKRLDAFQSLTRIETMEDSSGALVPAKVGAFTLTTDAASDGTLSVMLSDASDKVVRTEQVKPIVDGKCTYRPLFRDLHTDAAGKQAFVAIPFLGGEGCKDRPARYLVWPL
jgi:hypothetical protein